MKQGQPLTDGERGELTAALVSRCVLDCDGTLVRRLTVRADGDCHALLIAPDADGLVDLGMGETARFEGVLGCTLATTATEATCPRCETTMREGRTLDTLSPALRTAAERLGLDGTFGVVTPETAVSLLDDENEDDDDDDGDGVDDWEPMPDTDSTPVAPTPPALVCPDCGEQLSLREYERLQDADGSDADPGVENGDLESQSRVADAVMASPASPSSDASLGFATGGAKDVDSFRENVAAGFTPQPSAITDEGLFYDYHFETGGEAPDTDALFVPRYATALSDHPLSGERERYLSVGLDSNLSADAFERPRLELVVALDVSGSMTSQFDQYYYDEHGRRHESEADATTKLEAAVESVCVLTRQLRPDDRLGIVLYDHRAHVAKPMREVGATDMQAIRRHLREVGAGGSTNLADGFEAAVDLLADGGRDPGVERRVVFATDMMPNTGTTGESELTSRFADAAASGVHTTFVGMGLDANADLARTLSGIRGANHYFVSSADEFERRLGEEFAYMVSPLVYDLALDLEGEGWEVAAVHGSPTAEAATGRLLHVGTLFPSPKEDGEGRGSVVLVRLERTDTGDPAPPVDLVASWTERDGDEHVQRVSIELPTTEGFAHSGVRKAVALSRYARELRAWAADVHGQGTRGSGIDDWVDPNPQGRHERGSVPLSVPERYGRRFRALRSSLAAEHEALGDPELAQELDLLATLCEAADLPAEVTEGAE